MQNKTFRLFISSTFSDFSQERRLLQTYVFPQIKKYCTSLDKGYTFQPIDLRWGVSNEAQLDQKTLELCIDEVRNSKSQPHPNFLIMAGDRYGWIPLPYAIEKSEFETIVENTKDDEKNLLNTWYKLDYNQLPASYIIEERSGEYEQFDTWVKVEDSLRDILQTTVSKLNFSKEQQAKYFTSATEQEVIDGVLKYAEPTPFQCKLLEKNSHYKEYDFNHVYGYVRDIKNIEDDEYSTNFIDSDNIKVKEFKEKIVSSIKEENLYQTNVELKNISRDKNNGSLNYNYNDIENEQDSKFVQTMIEYLKSSIDSYSSQKEYTKEELISFEQERYKKSKLKNYIPREKAETRIENYISDSTNEALVIYGKSGLGKSALMAKAIEETKKDKIYRFVGSTSNLTTTVDILISILGELGIKEKRRTVKDPQTLQDKPEEIEEFYYRVNDHLLNITKDIVIFIDAIDQVENEDQFLWLPSQLPSNLKIIITTLKDENYQEDSKYFEDLQTKSSNTYPLEPFTNRDKLIKSILKEYSRTLSVTQLSYLKDIYKDINSPLYLTIAAQEIRHWKYYDDTQTLSYTQQGIIKEYMENLTALYHHDKKLIKKVFSYIYLAEGLSESELLEILSIDEEFINYIAPDTYHNNTTKELPIVIWARLHSQIKEFIKLENKEGYETMNFFHREFNDIISNQKDLQEVHEEFIELIEKLIVKYQDEAFDSNRWGRIYSDTIITYHLKYETIYNNTCSIYYEKIITQIGNLWLNNDSFKYSLDFNDYLMYKMETNNKTSFIAAKIGYLIYVFLINKINFNDYVELFSEFFLYMISTFRRISNRSLALELSNMMISHIGQSVDNIVDDKTLLTILGLKIQLLIEEKNFSDAKIELEKYLNDLEILVDIDDEYLLSFLTYLYLSIKINLNKNNIQEVEKICDKIIFYTKEKDFVFYQFKIIKSMPYIYKALLLDEVTEENLNKGLHYLSKLTEREINSNIDDYIEKTSLIVTIYKKLKDYDKAITYNNKLLEKLQSNTNISLELLSESFFIIFKNKAELYKEVNEQDKALVIFLEQLQLLEKYIIEYKVKWLNHYIMLLDSIIELYIDLKDNNSIEFYFNKLYNVIDKKSTEEIVATSAYKVGEFFIDSDIKKANKFYNIAFEYYKVNYDTNIELYYVPYIEVLNKYMNTLISLKIYNGALDVINIFFEVMLNIHKNNIKDYQNPYIIFAIPLIQNLHLFKEDKKAIELCSILLEIYKDSFEYDNPVIKNGYITALKTQKELLSYTEDNATEIKNIEDELLKIENNTEKKSVYISEIVKLMKIIAFLRNENEITLNHLIFVLTYITLTDESIVILSALIEKDLSNLRKQYNGLDLLTIEPEHEIKFDMKTEQLINVLQISFDQEVVGYYN